MFPLRYYILSMFILNIIARNGSSIRKLSFDGRYEIIGFVNPTKFKSQLTKYENSVEFLLQRY